MAERKAAPSFRIDWHPADRKKNFEALAEAMEVLLPDVPVISEDLPAAVEVAAEAAHTFDLTVEAAARGTLSYQWQKADIETPTTFVDIGGATSVDYAIATWADETHAGVYRCKIVNTLNNVTSTVYSAACTATTEGAA